MKSVSPEKLRWKFLTDDDAERLYRTNPELKEAPDGFCPTCSTKREYTFRGQVHKCDCQLQTQLYKHYMNAGIGPLFQRLDWEDYYGDPEVKESCEIYLEKCQGFISQGMGIVLYGDHGTGKTMACSLVLKDLLKMGYSVYSLTFASLIEMVTSGWRSVEENKYFQRKVRLCQVLLIDDIGREFKNRLSESTLDDILRTRIQLGKPTFITSNMEPDEIGKEYSPGVFSLLQEVSLAFKPSGKDFRELANQRKIEETSSDETRPIV